MTMNELFNRLGKEHVFRHTELKKSKMLWAMLPPGLEKDEAAKRNLELSSNMMLLRDIARVVRGIDPEDDENPFGGPDDY